MADSTYNFQDKVVLVTGGASGIGAECAIEFAQAGARLVVADYNKAGAQEVAQKITAGGGKAVPLEVDVSSEPSVIAMLKAVRDQHGTLDFAINSAGIIGAPGPVQAAEVDNYMKVLGVNCIGTMLCMREELRLMPDGPGRVIVNLASVAGLTGFANSGAYCASKHAVVALTKVVALENAARGIRVNAVCPYFTKTPLFDWYLGVIGGGALTDDMVAGSVPMKRLGKPSEVAGLCLWLCSEASAFVTGQAISTCGGVTAGHGAS
jgi:NAD(P)-dependent dehydrogenase (short-subunit alcohol dehydrogenase family)